MKKHSTLQVYDGKGMQYDLSVVEEEKPYNPDFDETTIEERVNSGEFQLSDFEHLTRLRRK